MTNADLIEDVMKTSLEDVIPVHFGKFLLKKESTARGFFNAIILVCKYNQRKEIIPHETRCDQVSKMTNGSKNG